MKARVRTLAALLALTPQLAGAAQPLAPRHAPPAAFSPRPAPPSPPEPERAPALEPPEPSALPAPAPRPADRMMIRLGKGERLLAAGADMRQPLFSLRGLAARWSGPIRPSFECAWLEQDGLRLRLEYLRPRAIVAGTDEGWRLLEPGGSWRLIPAQLSPAHRRDFPLYLPEDEIELRLIVENAGRETRAGLEIEAVQERFNPAGRESRPLGPAIRRPVAGALPPGGRAEIRWTMRLGRGGRGAVNLEQTHVRVRDGAGRLRLDAPQAGVVDPPRPGLL